MGATIRNSSSWPTSKNQPPAGQANLSLVRGLKPFRRLSCRRRVEDPTLVFFFSAFALLAPLLLLLFLVVPLVDTKLKNTYSSRYPQRLRKIVLRQSISSLPHDKTKELRHDIHALTSLRDTVSGIV